MKIEQIGDSFIGYNEEHDIHIREYYNYCVELIRAWLLKTNYSINIILGNYNIRFSNQYMTYKFDIQCEHTLVKVGGRSINEIIPSGLPSSEDHESNDDYLIRIDKYDHLNSMDGVIEYSLININNVKSDERFNSFSNKTKYIAPLLYDLNFNNINKEDTITLFSTNSSDRRTHIINEFNRYSITFKQIENCFSKQELLSLYDKTRIMVNIHQTDHHRTFEELRVLPALLNGVLIISEDTPFRKMIPYHEYIIWSKYEDISETVLKIKNNYELYFNHIFGDKKLKEILKLMQFNNNIDFSDLIK